MIPTKVIGLIQSVGYGAPYNPGVMPEVAAPAVSETLNMLPAAAEGTQALTQLGVGAGGISMIAGILYFVWRKLKADSRDDVAGNIQNDLISQLQAASDAHVRNMKEVVNILDAERAYSATLTQRLVDVQRAWAEEKILWESERITLTRDAAESKMRIDALNAELSRMGEQVRAYTSQLAGHHPAPTLTIVEGA